MHQKAGSFIGDTSHMGGNLPSTSGCICHADDDSRLYSHENFQFDLEDELSEVLGLEVARALTSAFAGNRLYAPKSVDIDHRISRAIGLENANKFCKFWFGTIILFPITIERKRRILKLYSEGKSPQEIVSTLLISERYVFQTLSEFRM